MYMAHVKHDYKVGPRPAALPPPGPPGGRGPATWTGPHEPTAFCARRSLKLVGDGPMVAPYRRQLIGHAVARNALVVAAGEGRRQADVRGAGFFPEVGFLGPIRLGPGSHRNPDLDPDLCRVAARLLGQATQPAEGGERAPVRPIRLPDPPGA